MSLGSPQRAEAAPHPRIVEDPPSSGYKRRTLQTQAGSVGRAQSGRKPGHCVALFAIDVRSISQLYVLNALHHSHFGFHEALISAESHVPVNLQTSSKKGSVLDWIPIRCRPARWSAQKGGTWQPSRPGARCPPESPAFALNYRIAHAAWRKLLCEATRSQ